MQKITNEKTKLKTKQLFTPVLKCNFQIKKIKS